MQNNIVTSLINDGFKEDPNVPIFTNALGQFAAIKLDIGKPGKSFFNLSQHFNGMIGEYGNELPVIFYMNNTPVPLDNTQISYVGNYPDINKTSFTIVGVRGSNNSYIINFPFPPHFFQTVGDYVGHFEIKTGDRLLKTTNLVFSVESGLFTVATDFENGVSPYDTEFDAWRDQIKAQLKDINDQATRNRQLQDTVAKVTQSISDDATQIIDKALGDVPKLDETNTFTNINSFNNGLNANNLTVTNNINSDALYAKNVTADVLTLNKALMLNGADITKGLIKQTASLHGTPINGITWFYANIFKFSLSEGVFAICAMEFNIPNNSTMQGASESNPVPIFQFPKGSLDGLGGTVFSSGTALLKLDTANDTLDFCGLTSNDWDSWGKAVRDYKPIFSTYD